MYKYNINESENSYTIQESDDTFDFKEEEYESTTDFDNDKLITLADYLEIDPTTMYQQDDNTFSTQDGEEYLVLTESEAQDMARDQIESIVADLGISAFNKDFIQAHYSEILDDQWFEEAQIESYQFYVDDLDEEEDSTYGNRLIQELYDNGIISDDDFEQDEDGQPDFLSLLDSFDIDNAKEEYVEKLCAGWDDPIEWYVQNFGDHSLTDIIREENIVDIDALTDLVIQQDGLGHILATYDGDEIMVDDYYIFRIN